MGSEKCSRMRKLRMYVKLKKCLVKVLAAAIMFFICVMVYFVGHWGYYGISQIYHVYIKDDANDAFNSSKALNANYRFYENGGHSYVRDVQTRKKVLKNICWMAGADNLEDSLLCFASDGYRGFFNRNSGEVSIPADRYRKAWLFSDGLAVVMESDSTLKFINPAGKVVADPKVKYATLSANRGYLFKNGNCPAKGENQLWGLLDKKGGWSVTPEFDDIVFTRNNCWICYKNGKQGLLNDKLQLVVKPDYREVLVTDKGIEVLLEDYTRQLLDFNGEILEHHIYTNIKELSYKSSVDDDAFDGYGYEYELSPYLEYQTTYTSRRPARVGLMDPNGNPVTPPLYTSIEAVNANCFRCFFAYVNQDSDDEEVASILINQKGQRIE